MDLDLKTQISRLVSHEPNVSKWDRTDPVGPHSWLISIGLHVILHKPSFVHSISRSLNLRPPKLVCLLVLSPLSYVCHVYTLLLSSLLLRHVSFSVFPNIPLTFTLITHSSPCSIVILCLMRRVYL